MYGIACSNLPECTRFTKPDRSAGLRNQLLQVIVLYLVLEILKKIVKQVLFVLYQILLTFIDTNIDSKKQKTLINH